MLPFLLALMLTGAFAEVFNVAVNNETQELGFEVDYLNDQFLLDGKPFRYVSGSFHYFRAPKQYWRSNLRKMRAAGLNAVSTYVEWSFHQPEENQWNWSGDADLEEFLSIAQEEDLFVLLRPGPYICAERDFGGLPYWLLTRVPDIRLRTHDPRYMKYVEVYLKEVFDRVEPFLRGNGGPVIMVQVENEYGSYGCDRDYLIQLRDLMRARIGSKALLYSTDGNDVNMLRCGHIDGVYTTIDFGTAVNVTESFQRMRRYQPRGPLVNSEFYPGWISHWQEPFSRVTTSAIVKTLDEMLAKGASVNFYMFFGGTNFGYTAGANGDEAATYTPQLTSYDYDAPLSEAGDPTRKYFEIRNTISKYLPLPNMSLPNVSAKGDYGPVLLSPIVNLFEPLGRQLFATIVVKNPQPLTFEALGLSHWLVLYEANLINTTTDPSFLHATVRDRGLIYVDDYLIGSLTRSDNLYNIAIENPYAQKLKILIENQGRQNFGKGLRDFKGVSEVMLNNVPLTNWKMTGYRLDDVSAVKFQPTITLENGSLRKGPVILRGTFTITGEPLDTYLNTNDWGKGVAFVNGRNLGRYWPRVGPQVTLYVPAPYLRTGENELVLVELEYVPNSRKMTLQPTPILDYKL